MSLYNTLSLNQFPVHNKEQTFLDQQRRRRRCDIVFEGDNFQEEKKWPLLMKAEWVTFFTEKGWGKKKMCLWICTPYPVKHDDI